MYRDEIVEEVRKVREQHLAKFNYDIKAMCEDARKRQADSGHAVVSFAAKPKPKKKS
jgi:hypothetical protein